MRPARAVALWLTTWVASLIVGWAAGPTAVRHAHAAEPSAASHAANASQKGRQKRVPRPTRDEQIVVASDDQSEDQEPPESSSELDGDGPDLASSDEANTARGDGVADEEWPDLVTDPGERQRLFHELGLEVEELERRGNILKTVVRLVSPTVVHIEAEKRETSGSSRPHTVEEAGSGVVIEFKGKFYVLTNRHVIKDARLADIRIKFADGRELKPVKTWADAATDVAAMALDASDLVAARLGDSRDVEIGDFVLAVGSPFGLSHSVTYGIISAKGRRELELGDVELQDFMQTDASINPGNSGGPLLNLRGEVIGINTAIASNSGANEGIGFSIPINMAMYIARQLIERGHVVRAFMGVTLDSKFNAETAGGMGLSRPQGARITGLTPGAPAEAAHLKVDDVVLQFNGIKVQNDTHLVYLVSLTEVGREVPLVVFRDRKMVHLTVKVSNYSEFKKRQ